MLTKKKPTVKKTVKTPVAAKRAVKSKKSLTVWSKKEDATLTRALKAGHSAVETATLIGRTVNAVWNRKYRLKSDGVLGTTKSFRNHATPMVVKKAAKITAKSVAKKTTVKTTSKVAKKTPASKARVSMKK